MWYCLQCKSFLGGKNKEGWQQPTTQTNKQQNTAELKDSKQTNSKVIIKIAIGHQDYYLQIHGLSTPCSRGILWPWSITRGRGPTTLMFFPQMNKLDKYISDDQNVWLAISRSIVG